MFINYCDKITYRFYKLQPSILVVYNFSNSSTYYYDSISADLLYAILLKNENKIKKLIELNEITDEDYCEFIKETEILFNTSKENTTYGSSHINEVTDNEKLVSQIQNDLYKQNIMFKFHIDVTGRCNFRCVHCYHPFENYKKDTLNIDDIDSLFAKLYSLGVFIITISGGEPFLRKDIFEIIKKGEKYGFVFQILTNGYLLNEEMIAKIANRNISKLSFSYYGSENSHFLITGHSDFRSKLLEVVNLCIKYNIKYELKFILLKININDFDEYIDLCKKLNIRPMFEPCLIPKLDGDTSNFKYKLDFESYRKFMISHIDFFYDGVDLTQYKEKSINCSAGRYGLYCDHEGNIYPCVSYREYLGDYTEVTNIWNNSNKLKTLRGRKFKQFTTFNKFSFCKYCYQICPGLSLCENNDSFKCYNSGCLVAEVIEEVKNNTCN